MIDATGKEFNLGDEHIPFIKVPKGGSSCSSCRFEKNGKCLEKNFVKWYGTDTLPSPLDSYCSDWYEPKENIKLEKGMKISDKLVEGKMYFDTESEKTYMYDGKEKFHGEYEYKFLKNAYKAEGKTYFTGSPLFLNETELEDLIPVEEMKKGSKIKEYLAKGKKLKHPKELIGKSAVIFNLDDEGDIVDKSEVNVIINDIDLDYITFSAQDKEKQKLKFNLENRNELGFLMDNGFTHLKDDEGYKYYFEIPEIITEVNKEEKGMKYNKGNKISRRREKLLALDKENIKSNYPTKDPEIVWNEWKKNQRIHFFIDHHTGLVAKDELKLSTKKYVDLPENVKHEIKMHILSGRYEEGNKFPEKNWDKFSNDVINRTQYKEVKIKEYGVSITPYSPNEEAYIMTINLTRHEMLALIIKSYKDYEKFSDEKVKSEINEFIDYLLQSVK